MERFYKKVTKTESCWNWNAAGRGNGYGAFKYKRKTIDAHRMSWIISNGEIPKGLFVCHKCDNRRCVNPDHLFLGTHKENMADCSRKGRIARNSNPRYGNIPAHSAIKDKATLDFVKSKIKDRSGTLKELAKEVNISYAIIRGISSGRTYNNENRK